MGNAESVPEPTADDKKFLDEAIKEARKGMFEGGIPVGAVLVVDGKIVGRGNNRRVQHGSPILHAEMMCLESAGRLPLSDYRRATMYTTLSPCSMCAGAVLHYQIPRVVIADSEHFQGEEMLLMTRGVEVMSLDFPDAKVLVKEFIELHPDLWAEDTGMEAGSGGAPPRALAAAAPTPALPAPAAPALAAPPAEPEPEAEPVVPTVYEEPAYMAAPPRSATPASMMNGAQPGMMGGDNMSQYAGSVAGTTPEPGFMPPPSSTPLLPDEDAVLPPSAPPSLYGDDAASMVSAPRDGSVIDGQQ